MTPEELERLESCTAEIAKILYNNTPPSELTSLENIEKHLRKQWLEKVGPQIGFFLSNKQQEQNKDDRAQ
ncbi:MAG: hypothetical protein JGK38_10965 [Microcoleus sp. PH2017_15_JOR_U_A]|uniref:hypothetical protein n=1 Tax=unclassified Microcoleus TaxID=2642155 RepID=UPI001DE80435|nr:MULTISPECIES: hypothetical protein [unclassified Microcoleus]MCC3476340.1 hypothetical protein [Microcoleus sp. PH2017_13_LAR_U_A]MCC3488775.1 hypothetical protein [Microcoleus sp. PH2017_14_LAR_D_A]MCC3497148.1 hypothetical protein [Microcoleus sp. PH2017_15_JOR_U_A]MCC3595189.1 hypothetical protein [Microcoleus sp. PH2017_28_MFU_U_A]MCC3601456.1 hypothetical protein [Microcoleus sp. PH2017_26_ELK_O_A]